MNVKGGGLNYVSDFHSDEMKAFRGGLRNVPYYQSALTLDSKRSLRNYHDRISYERGFIQHSRSPSNQHINFHFMYGGFKKYFVDRLFYQTWYRKNIRNFWLPAVFFYSVFCMTMRMYDNAAYDHYYFID